MTLKNNITQLWWTPEIEEAVQQKRKSYQQWLAHRTTENLHEYKRNKAKAKNKINKETNRMWELKCQ